LHGARRTSLDGDDADVVGNHVMELSGDSGALLVRGQPPVLVPITLEPRRPLLELGDVGAPSSKVVADQPGGGEKEAGHRDGDRGVGFP